MKKILLALGLLISGSAFAWGECGTVTTPQYYHNGNFNGGWGSYTQALPCPSAPSQSATDPRLTHILKGAAFLEASLAGISAVDAYIAYDREKIFEEAGTKSAVISCQGFDNKWIVLEDRALYLHPKMTHYIFNKGDDGVYSHFSFFGRSYLDVKNLRVYNDNWSRPCKIEASVNWNTEPVDLSKEDPMVQYLAQQMYGK